MAHNVPESAFKTLWSQVGLSASDLAGAVTITGRDPVVPSVHRLGAASSSALAAQAAAIAAIWKLRSGEGQDVAVDLMRAVVPGLQTVSHIYQNGRHMLTRPISEDRTNFFPTADGRRMYLLRVKSYVDLLTRLLDVLSCGYESASMAKAVAKWRAVELEDALAARGAVGVIVRGKDEWRSHPQGRWLAERAPIDIEKIGDSPPEPFGPGARPLEGVRVLDCTHVLAGPVTGRMLAEQGADVLHVSSPSHLDGHAMLLDTGPGKRSALLDLGSAEDVQVMRELVRRGDVFLQSWRPGAMDRKGLSPEALAEQRPGIIYTSISCYGSGGPWRERGGFEPLGQAACGLVNDEGSVDQPRMAPTMTMNDYLVPYLASAGIAAALIRRAREGGSYHVKVSLTRASMFVQDLGVLDASERADAPASVPRPADDSFVTMGSAFGELRFPAPIARYSKTPAYWTHPPVPLGGDDPAWLARAQGRADAAQRPAGVTA